jgi:hypothetical protein
VTREVVAPSPAISPSAAQGAAPDKWSLEDRLKISIPLKEMIMSKGQRGNKEAKKPKKVPVPPTDRTPAETAAVPHRPKR